MSNAIPDLINMTQAQFDRLPSWKRKELRKKVRSIIRADLQRRAITGEPSPFKRAPQ